MYVYWLYQYFRHIYFVIKQLEKIGAKVYSLLNLFLFMLFTLLYSSVLSPNLSTKIDVGFYSLLYPNFMQLWSIILRKTNYSLLYNE